MRNIVVEVPYLVCATVVPPRKRNPVGATILGSVPVNLRVKDIVEMPIAFLYLNKHTDKYMGSETSEADFVEAASEVRWDGTRLLSSIDGSAGRIEESGIEAELARMNDTPFRASQRPADFYVGRPQPRGTLDGRHVQDNELAVRAGVIAAAGETVFCDGRFWTECPEPVWVTIRDFNYNRVEATLACPDVIKASSRNRIFAADRLDDAMASFPRNDRLDDRIYTRGMIRVLIPAAMRLPLCDQSLLATAGSVLESLARQLHDKSKAFMVAYVDVRDALAATGPQNPMSRVTPELAQATADLLREWPGSRYNSEDYDRDRLVAARSAWVERLVAVDAPALPAP